MPRKFLSRWGLGLFCIAAFGSLGSLSSPVGASEETRVAVTTSGASTDPSTTGTNEAESLKPTHKQTRIIKPLHNNAPIQLNTYCLDKEGNILACVGGDNWTAVLNADGTQEVKKVEAPKLVQFISPEGKLIRETALPFTPTAINLAPDGTIFVAGGGKMAKLSAAGEIITTADSPHVGDMNTFKQRVEEGYKKQIEEMTGSMKQQVTLLDERLKKLLEKPEAERTERDKKRIEAVEQQKTVYTDQIKMFEESYAQNFSGDQAVEQKLGITAVAVTSTNVFLCCNAVTGYGYEVWKLNHEFSDAEKVVDNLSGCCGQCDIQATESNLILAENTRFLVSLLDHEGNRQKEFGKGDRKSVDGFGSCCNPMNVRCCSNGDILTAESSIGTIKRFSADGELKAVIGKARIGGGCKHVALGFDEARNRYYMMNVDKSHICVMIPTSEAPEFTDEELAERQAREGLGKKLVGEWSLDGTRPKAQPAAGGVFSLLLSTVTGSEEEGAEVAESVPATEVVEATTEAPAAVTIVQGEAAQSEEEVSVIEAPSVMVDQADPYRSTYLKFDADGKLTMGDGMFAEGDNTWTPARQDGNVLYVEQQQDGVSYIEYKIEFVNDNEALISVMFSENVVSSNRYKRVIDTPVDPAEKSK